MFQRAILIYPHGRDFNQFGQEKYVMESFVGYKYGTYYKLGLFCERTKPEDYPDEQEEMKMEVDESS